MFMRWTALASVLLLFATGVQSETIVGYAPHGGIIIPNVGEKTIPGGAPTDVVTAHGITFNIYYMDIINNTNAGFDGASGTDAMARVADALTYVASVLNETGTLDFVVNQSVNNSGSGTLAFAGTYYSGNTGFIDPFTLRRLHAVGNAKPSAGTEEMFMTVNFGHSWNFTANPAPFNQIDFQTVAIHEITHALGFTSLAESNGTSAITPGFYSNYDQFLRRRAGNVTLFSGAPPAFQGVASDFTNNGLAWGGASAVQAYQPEPAPGLFAPSTYLDGSSTSHWDTGNIVGGAVMEHAVSNGVTRRAYADIDIGALIDLGYANAAEPAVACELTGGCPDYVTQGTQLVAYLESINQLPPGTTYANADLDNLPSTVMLDRYELALLSEVVCGNTTLSDAALCTFTANRAELSNEGIYVLIENSADYVAALISISSEFQLAAASIGLTGSYTVIGTGAKALGEPLSPDGDPDQDGLTNQEEYDNVIADGGTEADYVEAALNPLLDGSAASVAALPLAGMLGAGALLSAMAGVGIGALRRKRNR